MSTIDAQSLEGYLFSDNKKEFLKKLIPGTESYAFYTLLYALNSKDPLTPEVETQVAEYNKRFFNNYSKNISIRALLRKFDDPSTKQEDKTKIIGELVTQYLQLSFHHSKPANITTSALNPTQVNYPTSIDPKKLLLENMIQSIYTDYSSFSVLFSSAFTKLDTKKIADAHWQIIEAFLLKVYPIDFEDFPHLIAEWMKKKSIQLNKVYPLLDRMSLDQLKQLGDLCHDFQKDSTYIHTLCKKEFASETLDQIGYGLEKQEKRDLMFKVYTWAKKQLVPLNSLITSTLYQVLHLDLELNKYNKALFLEFLSISNKPYSYMSHNHLQEVRARPTEASPLTIGLERMTVDLLIKVYLEEFFREAKDIEPFTQYLETHYLRQIFYSTKLMLGKIPESTEVLTSEKLKELIEAKELTICRYNKEYYKGNEPVVITLTIKNIPSLMIKTFELRPENYYLKELKQLDASINLDGLIASEEFNVDFNEPSAIRFTKEFPFESITKKKQGIFIVDFIGNGLSSRAVIRKGKLSFIEHQTVAGQLFTIVDEETKICKGNRTGIWIKDRFYKADEKGKVLIPFSSNLSEKAVLIHDDFAELTDIQLKQESFEFKCAYIYNTESFMLGNKAKVLLQPRLFLNDQPIGLDIIQDCSVDITTTNENNVPSTMTIEKVKLSVNEEVELEFSYPAKVREIKIQVKVKIVPVNKREPKEYTDQHTIQAQPSNNYQYCSLYLRNAQEGYELFVLGKNGEPKASVPVQLSFQNKYHVKRIIETLQTDAHGKITLGKLEEINHVEATTREVGNKAKITKSWNINNQKSVNYPRNIRICEGDEVILPILHNELNRHRLTFVETLPGGANLRNCLNLLKIDKRKLIISGLKEGFYKLMVKDNDDEVSIRVLKGTYWSENPNFLYANDTLVDIKADINNIVITDMKVNPKENHDLADITIETFVDQPKLARFHIFGMQFMEHDVNRTVKSLDAILPSQPPREAYLGLKRCQFLNNRNLGDEYCYVLDRKSQARYIGNTLEKPPILLKRTFIRETQTKEEQLADTQEFRAAPVREQERRAVGGKPEAREKKKREGGHYGPSLIDESLNFLATPGLIYSNLKANEHGIVTLKDFPIKRYSSLQIVATNLTSSICEIFPLKGNDVQTKDLRQKARDENSVFSINRISINVPKGEKAQIKDLTSSRVQIVDSLSKLFDAQRNLALFSNTISGSESYETWSFLTQWERLQYEEKLKKYDKFASHELNLFVYFKDHEFFAKVVVPFLRNKIEKTLVDYFLLNDEKTLSGYARIERFKELNSLEQILVILTLQKLDPKQANVLFKSLESLNSLTKLDTSTFKRFFDIVLESKKSDQSEPDGGATGQAIPQQYSQQYFSQSQAMPQSMPMNYMPVQQMMPMQMTQAYPGMMQQQQQAFGAAGGYSQAPQYDAQPKSFGANRRYAEPVMGNANLRQDFGGNQSLARGRAAPVRTEAAFDEYTSYGGEEYLEKRAMIQTAFQELEKTKEYSERHYYGQTSKKVEIRLNSFWVDVAKHIVETNFSKPFLTQNFIYAHTSVTEMIAALSFLSLPFKAQNHTHTPTEGRGIEIQAGSDLIIMTKAVGEAESDLKNEVLIIQKFYDPEDRYGDSEEEPGQQVEKEVDQYIIDKVYESTVIVTNLSAFKQEVQVLVEIPEGTIPIANHDFTKSHTILLHPYKTETITVSFYFPQIGKFKINPPSVSKKGRVLVVGKRYEIQVQKEKVYQNLETLNAVLTQGSQEDVLNFVRTKNIWNTKIFDFNAIYWLLQDKAFFLKFIEILRERKFFDQVVWQYGFYHKDIPTIQEYFISTPENSLSRNIHYLHSSLVQIDKLQILEYNPFINQRVHLIASEKNRILNIQLKEQYKNFIAYLCERNQLEVEHYLALVYYLLLQDRVEEAIRFFGKIDREHVRQNHQYELQYDYLAAYIDFIMGYPKFTVAREICQNYLEYPVLSWRNLFIDIANQLAEFDGEELMEEEEVEVADEKKQNLTNAQKEETASMEVQQTNIHITHQNVSEITLSFYRIDLEVLFSRNPFITKSKDEFSFIQPNEIAKINISNVKDLEKTVFEIPKRLQTYNLHIELKTESQILTGTYFSTSLQVQIIENYGQVKVIDLNNNPLSKVYVKCFAKLQDGNVSFYKDGYTDLRGRFDYATLNSNDISNIKRFAIFIMSDEFGSLIKEAKAPSKLGRFETKLLSKQKNKNFKLE